MYRVWYWAMIDRENDGRFIASIPDLGDLVAYGNTDKDAVAHVTVLAGERVRAAVDDGQPVPHRRPFREMPSYTRAKEVPALSSQSRLTAEQRGQRRPIIFLLELLFCHGEAIP